MQQQYTSKNSNSSTNTQKSPLARTAITQSVTKAPLTQQDIENQQYQQDRFEATKLEIQAKYGTITPLGQERLNLLQAKKAEFWQRYLGNTLHRGHDFSQIPVRRQDASSIQAIQPKLTIGAPGDKYEQEADRVAAHVVNQINAPVTQQSNEHLQHEYPAVQRNTRPWLKLQAKDGGMTAPAELESSIQQARGGGQPLADNVRKPMEHAFGFDFSGVKVHADTQAHQLNQSIQAKAFTTGQDVFFRQGAYEPGSRGGQELIAHELTHVVQQNGGAVQRSQIRAQAGVAQTIQPPLLIQQSGGGNVLQRHIDQNCTAWLNGRLATKQLLNQFFNELVKSEAILAMKNVRSDALRTHLLQAQTQFKTSYTAQNNQPTDWATAVADLDTLIQRVNAALDDWDLADGTANNTEAEQSEGSKLPSSNNNIINAMLAASNTPAQQRGTQPIAVDITNPSVPSNVKTLIKFIKDTNDAVGLEYRGNNRERPNEEARVNQNLVQDNRNPNEVREIEKAHYGLLRSWHIDNLGNLPDITIDPTNLTQKQRSYLAANVADFAKDEGVPNVVTNPAKQKRIVGEFPESSAHFTGRALVTGRDLNKWMLDIPNSKENVDDKRHMATKKRTFKDHELRLKPQGYAEFNITFGSDGRLVYDYINHRFFLSPQHYQRWGPNNEYHPFFELTNIAGMKLNHDERVELYRLRYWENRRREGLETLLPAQ